MFSYFKRFFLIDWPIVNTPTDKSPLFDSRLDDARSHVVDAALAFELCVQQPICPQLVQVEQALVMVCQLNEESQTTVFC